MSSPTATITHITIFGNRNAGKSSLFNAIVNQDIAVVDETQGTTTDPVHKRMELIPYGPILLTDTAGIDDEGLLGKKRVEKSKKMLSRTDFAIVLVDASSNIYELEVEKELVKFEINYVKVFNKIDKLNNNELELLKSNYVNSYFISSNNLSDVINFKQELIKLLGNKQERAIIGHLLSPGDNVALVIPIDSEAPKGRIILPQVQVIRDLLDYNVNGIVTNEIQLEKLLRTVDIKLVITDSQAFNVVKDIVPSNVLLTSFSIIFANYKSSISNYFFDFDKLTSVNNVLICESCTHNVSHEDIGMFKIPKLLKNRYGNINIDHSMGNDFTSNIEKYDLIIHCGSCMLNDSVMKYRIALANEYNVPISNYGLYLAYENGTLNRSIEIFK